MSKNLSTTLRSADDMLTQLMAVDRWPGVMNVLYPKLLESAGLHLNSHGLVLCLLDAFSVVEDKFRPAVALPLYGMIPRFIDAMVEDVAVATEAKEWYEGLQRDFALQKKQAA